MEAPESTRNQFGIINGGKDGMARPNTKSEVTNKFEISNTPKKREDNSMDEGYKLIIERLDKDAREREARISRDAREREERQEKRSSELENRLTQLHIDSLDKVEKSLEASSSLLKSEFKNIEIQVGQIKEQVNEIHNKTRFWVNLIVPGIVAIVVGVVTALLTRG